MTVNDPVPIAAAVVLAAPVGYGTGAPEDAELAAVATGAAVELDD